MPILKVSYGLCLGKAHSFGAHAVAAIGLVCVYPADAIADCWFPFDVF